MLKKLGPKNFQNFFDHFKFPLSVLIGKVPICKNLLADTDISTDTYISADTDIISVVP